MNGHELQTYCLSKKGAVETFPFGNEVRVYKVSGKVFALMSVGAPLNISLKCDPAWAVNLRQTYPAVQPGYHLNKDHWNTITCDGSLTDTEIQGMIDHSYNLILKNLPRKVRDELNR